jgi:hypothetical protein
MRKEVEKMLELELKKFVLSKGDLVRIKSTQFNGDGSFSPVEEYALVEHSFSCEWHQVNYGTTIPVILSKGIRAYINLMKVEIVIDLSEEEKKQIVMDILLSI